MAASIGREIKILFIVLNFITFAEISPFDFFWL